MASLRTVFVFGILLHALGFLDASCFYKIDGNGNRSISCVQTYVDSNRLSVGTVAGAVIGSLAFIGLVVLAVTIFCWWVKRKSAGTPGTVSGNPASRYVVRTTQEGASPNNPVQPQITVTNTETQQTYPMTSKDGSYTLRMHTGYDQ